MKKLDISSFEKLEREYKNTVEELKKKYNCEWEDSVHDSFGLFVKEIEINDEEISGIGKRIYNIKSEVEMIDIDNILSKATTICKEVDSFAI